MYHNLFRFLGKTLEGKKYKPLFNYFESVSRTFLYDTKKQSFFFFFCIPDLKILVMANWLWNCNVHKCYEG